MYKQGAPWEIFCAWEPGQESGCRKMIVPWFSLGEPQAELMLQDTIAAKWIKNQSLKSTGATECQIVSSINVQKLNDCILCYEVMNANRLS
ncbi:hypothetical protein XENTR_v10011827 [Xenopus tropicalis]|nr:hypothetical protein XENTR_v10011827 [Xenopus tropicalis]